MELIKKYKIVFISAITVITPFVAFAATINTIVTTIGDIVNLVLPIIIVIASVIFIWGIIMYILAAGSDERKKEAKNLIIWGIIGLFVIVAMWGLAQILGSTFGVQQVKIPKAPGEIPF